MTRNLKALGLALAAMLAIGAVAAAGAQAQETVEVTAAEYPTTIHGESSEHEFTAGEDNIYCEVSTFEGTITEQSPEVVVTPTYKQNCEASGFPMTVTHNGCSYRFYNGDTVGDKYSVTTDVVCPTSTGITVHAYAGGSHGFTVCTIEVPPQEELEGVTFHNNDATTDIVAEGTIEGIEENKAGLCGAGETDNAIFHLAPTTITGTSALHLIHNE